MCLKSRTLNAYDADDGCHSIKYFINALSNCIYQYNIMYVDRLHNLVTSRQQDKQTLAALERKLLEERKAKTTIEQQLQAEKKRKADDAAAAKAAAAVATPPAPR